MNNLILSFIEINLTLVILFFVYQAVKSNLNFRVRRFYLLSLPALSILVVYVNQFFSKTMDLIPTFQLDMIVVGESNSEIITQFDYLSLIYYIGFSLFFIWSFYKVLKIIQFIKQTDYTVKNNIKIAKSYQKDSFSFFNFIHLSAHLTEDEENIVLEHELIHCEKKHSLDIILMEIYHSFFWYNPLLFILKKEIIHVHEFEVDQKMYKRHKVKYIKHLLSYALGSKTSQLVLTSQFYNQLSLTKRTKIMTNKIKNKKVFLMALPLSVGLLTLVSWTQLDSSFKLSSSKIVNQDDKTYDKVDKMPEYKGGMEAMGQFLGSNIKYPKTSSKEGVEGKVKVQFIVDKSGAVKNVSVLDGGVNDEINNEAVRVVKSMPDWTPGEKDGKKVSVKMVIPIKFELTD